MCGVRTFMGFDDRCKFVALYLAALFILVGCASSDELRTSSKMEDALIIEDRLIMSEGYVEGNVVTLRRRFSESANVDSFISCFIRKQGPVISNLFAEGLIASLSESMLSEGAALARTPGVSEARIIFKENSDSIFALSRLLGEPAPVYGYRLAARKVENDSYKRNAEDFANWILESRQFYGPYFQRNIHTFPQHTGTSVDACMPLLDGSVGL
jgi:hypothetical protein